MILEHKNAERKVDLPILVLNHGRQRVFIPTPDDYETLERGAAREFNLGERRVNFETETFTICDQGRIRLCKAAYAVMRSELSVLEVVAEPASPVRIDNSLITRPTREITPALGSASTLVGDSAALSREVSKAPADLEPQMEVQDVDDRMDDGDDLHEPEEPDNINVTEDNHQSTMDGNEDEMYERYKFGGERPEESEKSEDEGSPSKKRIKVNKSSSITPKARRTNDDTDEVSIFDESTDGRELAEGSRSRKKKTVLREGSRSTDLGFPESVSSSNAQIKKPPRLSNTPLRKRNLEGLTKSPALSQKYKNSREPIVIASQPGSSHGRVDDPKFKVSISWPFKNQQSLFNTRGGHTIRKVLVGACREFKIDPNNARLMKVITEKEGDLDEDDLKNAIRCPDDLTLADCNIVEDDRLFIIESELDSLF